MSPSAPRLVPVPTGYPTIVVIDGIQASSLARISALAITDVLNEQPNTATLTVNVRPHGPTSSAPFNPTAFDNRAFCVEHTALIYPSIRRGQPIQIYSGAWDPTVLVFAGSIVTVRQIYEGDDRRLVAYQLGCTDYTRALNRRKVTKSYLMQSASDIVADLMSARLADGFTLAAVAPNLPAVAIDFTYEDMNRALTRLANRIGGYWFVDYVKVLHFFLEEPHDPPAPLELGGAPFDDLTFETDLSQVRTRVIVEAAGTVITAGVIPGDTMIPVRDPIMFPTSGGRARTDQQELTYTGVVTGGAGSLVGPGALPGAAPVATPIVGAGIEAGTHGYAVTYATPSGESLPSPIATVSLGRIDPPGSAPVPSPPTAGSGPNPGVHQYAVSFVSAAGETTPSSPGPPVTTTQAGGVQPPTATSAALRNVSGNLAVGSTYSYKTTITTAAGETLPGPAYNEIRPAAPGAPSAVTQREVTTVNQAGAGLKDGNTYQYYLAYVSGAYETGLSPYLLVTTRSPIPPIPPSPSAGTVYGYIGAGGGNIATGTYWYGISWVYGSYESRVEIFPGSGMAVNNANGTTAIAMNMWTCPDARCTGIKIWRSRANTPGTYYLNATLGNVQSYTDNLNDSALGAARPHTNEIGTPPPVGIALQFAGFVVSPDPKVTGVRLYRFVPSSNDFKVVTSLSNASVPFLDTLADGALGASRGLNTGPIGTSPGDQATVTVPSSNDARAVARKVYRSDNGAPYRYLTTVNNLSATTYIDNTLSVSSNPDAPTADSTGGALTCVVALANIPIGPAAVTSRKIYRTAANSPALQLLTTIANNTATTFSDNKLDSTLGLGPPTTNSTQTQQVALSKLPIGGSGVTARKLYRTAANQAPLKFLATISDNATTTYTDAAPDAALGAGSPPAIDTSGLPQPSGQVNAGATTIPVSGTASFSPTGGFAVVGNGELVIRYTGVTATALTGVPAAGRGALTSTVSYNASITVAPALSGIPAAGPGAIVRELIQGRDINLVIMREDVAAQNALKAIEGGDGIIEHYIQDRRLSAAGATTTADAELALFKNPEIRVTYTTRDVRTQSGKHVKINLPDPTNLVGDFLIQRVQLSQFDIPGVPPLRSVQASSTRFSFEDVLRRLELEVYA